MFTAADPLRYSRDVFAEDSRDRLAHFRHQHWQIGSRANLLQDAPSRAPAWWFQRCSRVGEKRERQKQRFGPNHLPFAPQVPAGALLPVFHMKKVLS